MKRTRSINLDGMRKATPTVALKPLTLAIAVTTLAGCGPSQPRGYHTGEIFPDVAACVEKNPGKATECQQSYDQAIAKASASAPKYETQPDCAAEFGENSCVPYRAPNGQSWFMPALGGFLFAQAINAYSTYRYMGTPLFSSSVRGNPLYNNWTYADGERLGPRTYGKTTFHESSVQPKPVVSRTISRGGFGSTVAAKTKVAKSRVASATRSSSSRSSWGG